MESIWIEKAAKKRKIHLVDIIYNPLKKHTNNFLKSLNIAIDRCITENENITIKGDFYINYSSHTERLNMNSVLTRYSLHSVNTKQPTRISRTTSLFLDYIITNKGINSQYITALASLLITCDKMRFWTM